MIVLDGKIEKDTIILDKTKYRVEGDTLVCLGLEGEENATTGTDSKTEEVH